MTEHDETGWGAEPDPPVFESDPPTEEEEPMTYTDEAGNQYTEEQIAQLAATQIGTIEQEHQLTQFAVALDAQLQQVEARLGRDLTGHETNALTHDALSGPQNFDPVRSYGEIFGDEDRSTRDLMAEHVADHEAEQADQGTEQ